MEEIKNIWTQLLDQLRQWGIEPWMAGAALGGLILLWIIIRLARRKPKAVTFPGLAVSLFQIAPLGRDAFLKILNPAGPVVLSQYKIIGRDDILVKNHLSGHRLEGNKEYSILLEASGANRLAPDFSLELTYIDEGGLVYRQRLLPGQQRVEAPKRV